MEIKRYLQGGGEVYFTVPLIDTTNRPNYKSGIAGAGAGGIADATVWYYHDTNHVWTNTTKNACREIGSTGVYEVYIHKSKFNNADFNFPIVVSLKPVTADDFDPQTVVMFDQGQLSDVNLTAIDGETTDGNNATLHLKKLSVIQDGNDEAVEFRRTDASTVGSVTVVTSSNGRGSLISAPQQALVLKSDSDIGLDIDGDVSAIDLSNDSASPTLAIANAGSGKDIDADEIGSPVALDGGTASLAGMLTKLADDNGGASYDAGTDSQRSIAAAMHLVHGDIVSATDASQFIIDSGVATNDAYNGMIITIEDKTDDHYEIRRIVDYVGATKEITLDRALSFTPVALDDFYIMNGAYANVNTDCIEEVDATTQIDAVITANASIVDILLDTNTTIPALIAALENISVADLQTLLGLNVSSTIDELGIAKPAKNPKLATAIMLHYMALRNKTTENGTHATISNDVGTTIAKAATTDLLGTFTVDELGTP